LMTKKTMKPPRKTMTMKNARTKKYSKMNWTWWREMEVSSQQNVGKNINPRLANAFYITIGTMSTSCSRINSSKS
jgi:hypothetical protein